jgi:hypothetical protein
MLLMKLLDEMGRTLCFGVSSDEHETNCPEMKTQYLFSLFSPSNYAQKN